MKSPFVVLKTLSVILLILGWLTVAGAVIGFAISLQDPEAMRLILALAGVITGLGLVVSGEMIGVVFAIERNTAETAQALGALVRSQGGQPVGASRGAAASVVIAPARRGRTCPNCGNTWEYGDECPDCRVRLGPA